MTKEEIIKDLIEDSLAHKPNEVMCYIAGIRKDNGKDYYTWGEVLDALNTREGYVWENSVKETVDLIFNHPEIFGNK